MSLCVFASVETMAAENDVEAVICCDDPLPFFDWIVPRQLGYRAEFNQWQYSESATVYLWDTARAFYLSDLRIEFTGQEASFTTQNQMLASLVHCDSGWTSALTTELYLNLPFDDNLLTDYALRESFAHNFELDTLELSQLFITVGRGNWALDLGRFVTPFGRYPAPINAISRFDVPFIRSESILFRETGLQLRLNPDMWRLAAAMTNGSDGRDTNSSKAIIARVGVERETLVAGASVKWQDGIGSEGQKEFNNHAGLDFAIRRGRWTLASEWIYDQYGLRRPGTPLDEINWGRSLYNRQLNNGLNHPISGWGWYVNAIREAELMTCVLGYGQFHPQQIGDSIHDQVTRRLLAKGIWHVGPHVDLLITGLFENEVDNAQAGRKRKGVAALVGMQFNF